jgi:hypothetical protein
MQFINNYTQLHTNHQQLHTITHKSSTITYNYTQIINNYIQLHTNHQQLYNYTQFKKVKSTIDSFSHSQKEPPHSSYKLPPNLIPNMQNIQHENLNSSTYT